MILSILYSISLLLIYSSLQKSSITLYGTTPFFNFQNNFDIDALAIKLTVNRSTLLHSKSIFFKIMNTHTKDFSQLKCNWEILTLALQLDDRGAPIFLLLFFTPYFLLFVINTIERTVRLQVISLNTVITSVDVP